MEQYKLLTPGPLTTTDTVKEMMLLDRCTWDDDYKSLTQHIRGELLKIANVNESKYTTILQQGSGSFVVESVLQTALSRDDHILIISNGEYGNRMIEMANVIGKHITALNVAYNEVPNLTDIRKILEVEKEITHVAFVHCETTTGILNPIDSICNLAKEFDKKVIVDAMSSFGGIPINVDDLEIDYLISSANKCIQGVPGFGFVVAKKDSLILTEGNAKSVSLDLYNQWIAMNDTGKWRFTSPTHVVAAFNQAIAELNQEGGVLARYHRFKSNNQYIIQKMQQLGFKSYIDEKQQSPIITTFLYPDEQFDFSHFYKFMKEKKFVLYPGKLMDTPSFRIGNIGDLQRKDFENLIHHIQTYQKKGENIR